MNILEVLKDKDKGYFFVKDITEFQDNVRFKNYFEDASFSQVHGESILMPYHYGSEMEVITKIEDIFSFYNVPITFSKEVDDEVKKYKEELAQFEELKNKAYSIRNNLFKQNPDLVTQFQTFRQVLSEGLTRKLYEMQELSAFHMAFSKNSCNFSVPGAGKTSIVYGAYAFLKSLPKDDPRHVERLVIIGPIASFRPWETEYKKCFGKEVNSFRTSGTKKEKVTREDRDNYFYGEKPSELTLIFHGNMENDKKGILNFLKKNRCMLVVDEAHKIKNPTGQWGQAAVDLSIEAISRIALTGTPAPNGYEDLFNLFRFIFPFSYKDVLKANYQNLRELSKVENPDDQMVLNLKDNISPFFMRIKKRDLGLPPTHHSLVTVKMSQEQRAIYDFIFDKFKIDFKADSHATVLDKLNKARLIRLRQAASNPSMLLAPIKDSLESNEFDGEYEIDPNGEYSDGNDSVEYVPDIIELIQRYASGLIPNKYIKVREIIEQKIALGEKTLVWTIFIDNAERLKAYLENNGIKVRLLIGKIDIDEREDTIKKFNNPLNEDFYVVIANPFSVSESISLHEGCRNAIYLERDYNCSSFLQSRDRIHRFGQKLDANYFYILSEETIDEVIDRRLQIKIQRLEELINDDIPLLTNIDDFDESVIIQDLLSKEH